MLSYYASLTALTAAAASYTWPLRLKRIARSAGSMKISATCLQYDTSALLCLLRRSKYDKSENDSTTLMTSVLAVADTAPGDPAGAFPVTCDKPRLALRTLAGGIKDATGAAGAADTAAGPDARNKPRGENPAAGTSEAAASDAAAGSAAVNVFSAVANGNEVLTARFEELSVS